MAKLDSADSDLDRSMVSGCINKVRVWSFSWLCHGVVARRRCVESTIKVWWRF
ncbi:unnamed protein product, partial [Brassica oleracea]